MNCNCNDKAIIIVRGNDTNFNDGNFLTINLYTTILDLSTFKATFKLGSIFRQIDDISSGIISLDFTAAETSKLPQFCYGTLKLIDASNRVATIESLIPFQVISVVNGNAIATEPYTLNFDVKQQGETILNVSVESAVTVELGTTTTLPAGSDATVTNSGSFNHLVLDFGIPRGYDGSVLSVNGKTGDVVLDYTDVGANPLITDENMLNADLVDDATAVHKFATAAELAQIETNKNDITALDNKYDSITGGLSDSITALDNKYDSVTGALDDKIDSINGALSDSITALDSVVSSNYTTLDGKIDSVNGALSDSITGLDNKYDSITGALDTKIDNHIGDTLNPHSVTKAQVGLGNCDNTSDANKPISTATQNALDSISGALSNEADIRQNADNGLQSQIDAIVVSSDVFDVVGTYAELQAYDISTVPVNDIIKVLVDSTHDNAATYYRCVENNNVKSWSYIGAEGAYYTKSEADGRFVPLTRTVNNKALSSNITLTASDVGALPDNTTIGDATLTIQVNSSTIDTFTANATSNKNINIQCATPAQGSLADTALQPNDNISKLTNNAGYITTSELNGYATETYVDTGLATKQDTLTEGSGIDISGGSTTVNPLVTLPLTVYETGTDKIFNASSTAYDGAVIYGKWDAGSVIVFSNDSTALSFGYGFYYTSGSIVAMARYDQQYFTLETISDIAYQSDFYYKIQFFQDGTIDMYYSLDGTTYNLAVSTTSASGGALYGQDIYVCGGNNSVLYECSLLVPSGGSIISCDNTIARVSDIPTNNNQLTNGAGYITSSALNGYATESFVTSQGYITGITSGDVTTALGYTPYNSSNPNGYQANIIETVKVNGTALTPSSKAVNVTVPTKISDLTDDTATYPIDKADTLTGLTASITELNYCDGVTSSIQTQLNGKLTTSDIVSSVSSSSTNSKGVGAKLFYDTCGDIETLINAL